MKEKKNSRIAFILSVLFHVVLLIVLLLHEHQKKKALAENAPPKIEWVELQPPSDELKAKQIVQQDDKSVNEEKPVDDYKLSKNDQNVLQETKAAKNGAFQNRKNTQEAPKKKAQPQTQAQKKQKTLDNLKPSLYSTDYTASQMAPPPEPAMSGAEVSQNDDYLKDVVAGAETLLRTREFVYYSYYNRIKSKLRQHWEPRIKEKIVKILRKGRRIASTNDKITRLVITLDKHGELKRIQVRNASGYNDLDDAAIEAFKAAAPFPNPPTGLVTGQGEVEIPWDFVLET